MEEESFTVVECSLHIIRIKMERDLHLLLLLTKDKDGLTK